MEPRPGRGQRQVSRTDEAIRVATAELERRRAMLDADAPLDSVTVMVKFGTHRAARAIVRTESSENVPIPFER